MQTLIVIILLLLGSFRLNAQGAFTFLDLNFIGETPVSDGGGGGGDTDVTNGIVVWWKFNEGSGTSVSDSSGNGNTGTAYNPTWVVDENAMQFFGTTTNGVQGTDIAAIDGTTNMTVLIWSRLDNGGSGVFVAKKRNGFQGWNLYYSTGARVFTSTFYTSDTSAYVLSSSTLPTTHPGNDGAWHHYGATYDGTNLKLFLDGTNVATGALTGTLVDTTYPLTVGGYYNNSAGAFVSGANGTNDDVRVYNVTLTADGIYKVYTNGLAQPGGHGL